MYLSPDEARSDVILAGAATVFGGVLLALLLTAPGVPQRGLGAELIQLVSLFVLSGLTPYLLARYRDDVPGGFGLAAGRPVPWGPALLLAAPVVVLGVLRGLIVTGTVGPGVLGRPGRALGSPVVGPGGADLLGLVLEVVAIAVLTIGTLLLIGFLVVRGRDAFRDDERSSTELLRTFGVAAAGAAVVFGGLRSLRGDFRFLPLLIDVLALGAIILIADRMVPPSAVVTRPAVLTPVALVLVAHVLAAGGFFRGDLLLGLTTGSLAAGVVLVLAIVAEHHRTTAVLVPLLLAVHWWPTCLGPLPLARAGACLT